MRFAFDAMGFHPLLLNFSNIQQSCKNPREYPYIHCLDSTLYILLHLLFHTPILLPTQPSIHPRDTCKLPACPEGYLLTLSNICSLWH